MKVKRDTLLLLACLVWSAAGINILPMGLRVSGLAPERFIAVFCTGLGAAPVLAGALFGRNYGRAAFAAARNNVEQKGV